MPSGLSGNRYAELLNVYYMKAWYDRYVRGDNNPVLARDVPEDRAVSLDIRHDGCRTLPEPHAATSLLTGAPLVAVLARQSATRNPLVRSD